MTIQQQQAYFYQQRQRQQAMYHHALNTYYILNIRNLITQGVNPATDPQIAKIYYALINEYGDSIFKFEDKDDTAILTMEEHANG